jgi:sugar diacid utilization regulator
MTLQEIVELPVLRPARVLTTPEPGQGRDVASVSVMEVPVDSFIRPGEFVMSTGMNIGQDRKLLACFVRDVAGAGASALALAIGPYTHRIPRAVIQLAKKEALTLIELPWELRFSDVSEAILRQLIHEQAVIRSRDDFVWSLASHNLTEEAAIAQGKHLGYDLNLVFVGLFGKVSGNAAAPSATIQNQARLAGKFCNNVAAQNRLQWVGTVVGDSIIGYFQISRTAPGISALLKQVRTLAAGRFTITWGVGRNCREFADFHRSYVDAGVACEIGARVRGVGSTTDATDVLADRILMNLRRDGDVAMLQDRYIKPLEESSRMPLLATLEAFFHHDCNASEASRSLSISRQAFLYRIARAETLMRVDLQNAEHRFAISLALRLRRFQDRRT